MPSAYAGHARKLIKFAACRPAACRRLREAVRPERFPRACEWEIVEGRGPASQVLRLFPPNSRGKRSGRTGSRLNLTALGKRVPSGRLCPAGVTRDARRGLPQVPAAVGANRFGARPGTARAVAVLREARAARSGPTAAPPAWPRWHPGERARPHSPPATPACRAPRPLRNRASTASGSRSRPGSPTPGTHVALPGR